MNTTLYIYTLKTTIFKNKKKYENKITVSKGRPNNRLLFSVISILVKIWKNTFPKEFFNEIWLIIGKHEYINIAVTNGQNIFPAPPKC